MLKINVIDASFIKDDNVINYKKLYSTVIINDLVLDLNLSFNDSFSKQIALSNINNAFVSFRDKTYKKNGNVVNYTQAVICFKDNDIEIPLKFSKEQIFILKLYYSILQKENKK